jgi:protoheme IX farnesyltransferase
MKSTTMAQPAPGAQPVSHSRVGDLMVLTKARLNALVVATTAGGYFMAAGDAINLVTLAITCVGTALVASGAAALNQAAERGSDRLMERTRWRPLADGRMSLAEGRAIGGTLALAGVAMLWLGANLAAAAVSLVTLIVYVVIYTPLKRVTSFATVIGAIPGALPPLIGWAAAGGSLRDPGAWALFFIMFVWQLPHFLAIAWICRLDYARAGMPMLSVIDPHGGMTGRQAALWSATLIPASLLPLLLGMATETYAVGATVLGLLQLVLAIRFAARRTDANARALFVGSITYLPLLWLLMGLSRNV